jgi:signal transduction histidine kinase
VAGTLAGSIAHEIKTPIATIQMVALATAEKIGNGPLADEVREQMDLIVRVVKHINKTVQSLLNLSRRKAGEKLVHQDLQSLLDEAAVLTRLRFQRHGVEIRVKPSDLGGLRLYCRPYEILQALIVLLNNSVDAVAQLPERWVELQIEQTQENCEFRVTDSGQGIPDEVSKRIFEPYFTTKNEGEGTGLGLAVAAQFVKDHGGNLSYLPTATHTTFLMSIPNTEERIQHEEAIDR